MSQNRGRPKIKAPTYEAGDVLALHHKGRPDGRRVKVLEVGAGSIKVQTIESTSTPARRGATTWISISTARPTANGWHLVERGGLAVRWDADAGKVVES